MRAVCIEEPGLLDVVEVPAPVAGPSDAVVDIAYAGICGSDVELLNGRRPADIARYPVIPGHEWSGVVRAVGASANADLVGSKVVGEGFGSCSRCARCFAGETVICETRYDEIGFTRPGAWADQLVIPAAQLHVLPRDADLRSAAALEPSACSADAVARASVQLGERVAVLGGGTIGCLIVQLLRSAGPAEIVVVDPNPHAAVAAVCCGATTTVDPAEVADLPGEFDVVIEAAGVGAAVEMAIALVRRGGRIVLVGVPDRSVVVGAFELIRKRVEVQTVFGAPHAAWVSAVDAFAAGGLDPGLVVTHELELADARDALTLLSSGAPDVGKVLLRAGSV